MINERDGPIAWRELNDEPHHEANLCAGIDAAHSA